VFSALVSGIDHEAAGTDPTSFFTYLSGLRDGDVEGSSSCETEFELLHAPPIIRPAEWESIRNGVSKDHPSITRSLNRARSFDLIVTSASQFDDPHCQLRRCFEMYSPETAQRLGEEGCVGDMLWQPLNFAGAMDTRRHAFQTLALVSLTELHDHIARGNRVLLALGPCASPRVCGRSRALVLFAILRNRLVTDVVVDKATAAELLNLKTFFDREGVDPVGANPSSLWGMLREAGYATP
jgi:DNA-binding transcriptional regulator LsrR (DeoR family)